MSSVERGIAQSIHRQREELTKLNDQLRVLNEQYPGERKKPFTERDLMYEALRSPLLNRRIELQGPHSLMRKHIG